MTLLTSLYGTPSGWSQWTNYFKVDIYLVSQDPETLKSDLQLQWFVKRPGSDYTTHNTGTWSQVVDGASSSGSEYFDIRNTPGGEWYHYTTTSASVTHNADGAKTAYISCTLDLGSTTFGSASASGNATLPAIPVQATARIKVLNSWTSGKVWLKQNGTWVKAKKIFTKVSGAWKEGK